MANVKSINGSPIVVGTTGIENGAVTDAKLAQSGGVLSEVGNLKSAINLNGGIVPTQFTKGMINAAGDISSSDNGVITPFISSDMTTVYLGDNCKAVVAFYNGNKTYIGKIGANGAVNQTSGSWMWFYGLFSVAKYVPSNSVYYRIIVTPTDSTVITEETYEVWGESKVEINYSIAEKFDETDEKFQQIEEKTTKIDDITKLLVEQESSSLFWEQGYWAIADGTKAGSYSWIRTVSFIDSDVTSINAPDDYYMYLMAYDKTQNDTYIGAWNQESFSKTYTANTGLHNIDLLYFKNLNPSYHYKISLIAPSIGAITPNVQGKNVYFSKFIDLNTLKETVEENKSASITAFSNIRVVNHRGFNIVAPENTIPAFELSAKMGYKYVETDVLFTAPDNENLIGIPVLLHDASINRTARNADGTTISGTVNIADITYEQALNYDFGVYKGEKYAGTKIPTFEEFIKTCKRLGLHPFIELKHEKTYSQDEIDMILSIIVANGMKKNVTFISFDGNALNLVKNRWDWVELGANRGVGVEGCLALMTGKNEVFVTHDIVDSIDAFKAAGIPSCPYTVDTVSQLQSLDPYYSNILTDGLLPSEIYNHMFAEE